jgi:hypothetical protein
VSSVNAYIELLKEELIDKCSSIDPRINRLRELKKADYELMREIIRSGIETSELLSTKQNAEQANTTVSVSTLERIFKYGYAPNHRDKRAVNTLTILCCFLEYADWEDFITQKKIQFNITDVKLEEVLEAVVRNADEVEFEAYKSLPEIRTENLKKHLIPSGTAYMRIYNILVLHSGKQWTINNENNPSGYKINKVWIESITSKEVIIKTREYWYLRWFEIPTQRYRHIYNEENTQTWTIVFEEGTWKVLSTYYPPPQNSIHITHLIIASLSKTFRWIK